MKKILTLLLCGLLCLAMLAACTAGSAAVEDSGSVAGGDAFVAEDGTVNETLENLLYAVEGETNANAKYLAFAEVAEQEGYALIAKVFRATADAELKHADDEYAMALLAGEVERPVAGEVTVGTTAENLQTAIDGETAEFTGMYPDFIEVATAENMYDAVSLFNLAMQAEAVHAGIYQELLADTENVDPKFETVYRCPVCGNIVTDNTDACAICNVPGADFIAY